MLYQALKPFLFSGDPEKIHEMVLQFVEHFSSNQFFNRFSEQLYTWDSPYLETHLWGKTLPNPVGLAAGFDKNGKIIDSLFSIGFGFVEVGTMTPRPQPGNVSPRLFRLIEDQALINRLGFNNDGMESLIERLEKRKIPGLLGVNLGKNQEVQAQ